MRLLLDTHVVLWWLDGGDELAAEAREAIEVADDAVLSAASVWEIAIKQAVGRLEVPEHYLDHLDAAEFRTLPMTVEHALAAGRLPRHHDDPFDRMLVAQARAEDLTLVTADRRLPEYGIAVLAAQ